jgi:adenine specific DNA methylase Mod
MLLAMTNTLYYGDNLHILRGRIGAEKIDLVYLDPPFNSNRSYNVLFAKHPKEDAQAQMQAFDDTWTWTQETDRLYIELIGGGASSTVADALQAMHSLLGENDVLAYVSVGYQKFGSPSV